MDHFKGEVDHEDSLLAEPNDGGLLGFSSSFSVSSQSHRRLLLWRATGVCCTDANKARKLTGLRRHLFVLRLAT